METKQIKAEQEVTLLTWKDDFVAQSTDKGVKYIHKENLSLEDYCRFVGIDEHTISLMGVPGFSLRYLKTEDNSYALQCLTYIEGELNEKLSLELTDTRDFMGLYSEKTDSSLENFFNDSLENVVRKLKEIYPDVVENIEQNVISNIRDYDLSDSDKEYFAESYIEDNPSSSVETAENYLSNDDKKRFICSWVDEL